MKRLLAGAVCAAAVSVALPGASAAAAQDPISPRRAEAAAGDTLTLTLPEAQRLAVRRNPAFLAERQEAAIARGRLRQARLPAYNPQASVELPGAGGGGGTDTYEAGLTQEFEIAGQRGLRARAAGQGVRRADAVVGDAARLAVADASEAFYSALAARRRLRLALEVSDVSERLVGAVRIQLREGEISALEANLAEIEAGRARARVLAARREAAEAELELRRRTGLPPEQPVRIADDLPAAPDGASLRADSLAALALARRPDLAAREAAAQEAATLGTLARREAVPNLQVGALARREDDGGGPRFGVGVGVALPVLNRNQGRVAEQRARTEQAEYETRAAELRVRSEVAAAVLAYRAASEEEAVYEASVLQPGRENRALLETAFRAGKIGLPTLLLVRNQLLDAELGYWESWLARRRALVALQAATADLPVAEAGPTEPTRDAQP